MRILFSGVPAFGHLLPLAPLARAARDAGHDVALLTSGTIAPAIAADFPGIPVLPAGPAADVLLAEAARRTGSDAAHDPRPEAVAEFFAGARIDLTIDEALEQARAWSPDLVVAEATDFVGPLVAAALGVPWDVMAFGPAVPPEFTAPMHEVAALRYAERRLSPVGPRHYIDPTPDLLQVPDWTPPAPRLAVRPEAHSRPGAAWSAPVRDVRRPRVLVTMGTVFSNPSLLEEIIRSLEELPVEVVVTTGVLPGQTIPADTADITYVGFEPMDQLLAGVAVVVSAGGAGTVLAAHSRGIPLVLIPQGADQPLNAARAEAAGTALVLDRVSGVAGAVNTLLSEGPHTAAARRVATQIAAMPDPATVVGLLTASVGLTESNVG